MAFDLEFMTYSSNRKLALFWVAAMIGFSIGWFPEVFNFTIWGTVKVINVLSFIGIYVFWFLMKNK